MLVCNDMHFTIPFINTCVDNIHGKNNIRKINKYFFQKKEYKIYNRKSLQAKLFTYGIGGTLVTS